MTDNWLLWVRPQQQEPIPVTATSAWPVCARVSVCERKCLNVCDTMIDFMFFAFRLVIVKDVAEGM